MAELRAHSPEIADEVERWRSWLAQRGLAGCDDLIPDRLGGFRLVRRIGGGGMGLVYLAEDESLDRNVALKVLRPEQMLAQGGKERFLREARAIAALEHPNIVPVHAVSEDRGLPFLVMEFVDGESLSSVLDAMASAGKASPADAFARVAGDDGEPPALYRGSWADFCVRVVGDACKAIVAAHGAGITHRDVKPSNLMLTRDGRVLLLDFGLAFSAETDALTRTHAQPGSLPYMAPEQLRGEPVDERIDVYALGVTLYQMLSLKLPFEAPTREKLRRAILDGSPARIDRGAQGVSWELRVVVETAMEPDPAHRYATAAELRDDLVRVLERKPIHARPPGALRRLLRAAQRRPMAATALVFAFLALVVGPLALWLQARSANLAIRIREQRAVQHFQSALREVNLSVETYGRLTLSWDRTLGGLRERFLARAIRFYEQTLGDPPQADRLAPLLARAWVQLAVCYMSVGRFDDCKAAVERAHASIDALRGVDADTVTDLRFHAGYCMTVALDRAGALQGAGELVATTLELGRRAFEWAPTFQRFSRLVIVLDRSTKMLSRQGRFEEAQRQIAEQEAILRRRLEAGHDEDVCRRHLVGCLDNEVGVHLARGDLESARSAVTRMREEFRELERTDPSRTAVQRFRTRTRQREADILLCARRIRQAISAYEAANRSRNELIRDFPMRLNLHSDHMATLLTLASLHQAAGQPDRVRAVFDQAAAHARRFPRAASQGRAASSWAQLHVTRARVERHADVTASRKLLREALRICNGATGNGRPTVPLLRGLAAAEQGLAELAEERSAEKRKHLVAARDHLLRCVAAGVKTSPRLIQCRVQLARDWLAAGDPDEAERELQRGLEEVERGLAGLMVHGYRAELQVALARVHASRAQPVRALELLETSLDPWITRLLRARGERRAAALGEHPVFALIAGLQSEPTADVQERLSTLLDRLERGYERFGRLPGAEQRRAKLAKARATLAGF